MATAEDTIVAKLEWPRFGGSERQLRDVAEMLRIGGSNLDHDYIATWAADIGVSVLLEAVRRDLRLGGGHPAQRIETASQVGGRLSQTAW